MIGIAKGPSRKVGLEQFFEYQDGRINLIHPSDDLKYFLLSARDEAHRFVNKFHRKNRAKKRLSDPLEGVSGLGAKKLQSLIRHFGGRQGIKHASVADLKTVPGIGPSLAQRIFDSLN